jgi:hypothetical protein
MFVSFDHETENSRVPENTSHTLEYNYAYSASVTWLQLREYECNLNINLLRGTVE